MATKVKPVLQSLDDVEQHIGLLAQTIAEIKQIEAVAAKKQADLLLDQEERTNPLYEDVRRIEGEIVQFVENYMNLFRDGESKSRTFATGKITTREDTKFDWPENGVLVELIKDTLPKQVDILIKRSESPVKKAIQQYLTAKPELAQKLGITMSKEIGIDIKPF